MSRIGTIFRETRETRVSLEIDLDHPGEADIQTGIGFFDHMLELWARHAGFRLRLTCEGDLHVDAHHTVEDVGICLGDGVRAALGDKRGIARYGSIALPMDEALVTAAWDLSGRSFLAFHVEIPVERVGSLESELVEEFWRAFTSHAGCGLHLLLHYGRNSHHIVEAIFKATGRALAMAVTLDPKWANEVPSTKGSL